MEFPEPFLVEMETLYRDEIAEMMWWLREIRGPYTSLEEQETSETVSVRQLLRTMLDFTVSQELQWVRSSNSLVMQLYLRHSPMLRDILSRLKTYQAARVLELESSR